MPQLVHACPHCKAEKIGFATRAIADMRPSTQECLIFLQCEGCGQGLCMVYSEWPGHAREWLKGSRSLGGSMTAVYPKMQASLAPPDVPKQVQTAFLSGLDNLGRPNGANAAAIMFRRSIEVAVKVVNSDGKGDLKTRIGQLPDSVATPAMKEWAHHIRLDGNDAVHDIEEYSLDDAKQLHTFAEMFLTYAFTLPAMMKRARPPEAAK